MFLYGIKGLTTLITLVKPRYLLLTSLQFGVEVLVFSLQTGLLMVQTLTVLLEFFCPFVSSPNLLCPNLLILPLILS